MPTQKQKEKFGRELFSPIVKTFQREKIIPKHIDECWSIDLIDFSDYGAENNKGYRYVFTCIDIFSKYAWGIPIKNKSSASVLEAFKKIINQGRKPLRIWSDRGKEFYNKVFMNYLKQHKIELYSTYSDLKAVFVERFNRTLRDLLKVPVFVGLKYNWIEHLEGKLKIYNNRKHGTIKMSPIQGSLKENEDKIYHLFHSHIEGKKPKFKVGDYVRIPDKKSIYSKGDTTNWSYELFKIYEMVGESPPVYLIKDEAGEKLLGKNYEQELLKSEFNYKTNEQILKSMKIEKSFQINVS